VHEGSQATVEAILEGTARTLVKRGYAGTTTNHIASEGGVGIGSFYEYFENKDAAVSAVVDRFAARAFSHAVKTAGKALQKTQLDAVHHFIGEMVEFIAADAKLVRTLYQQVPFVWEMPRVQGLVSQLERFGLELANGNGTHARTSSARTPEDSLRPKVHDRFYVIGVAVGASIVQIATDPSAVSRRAQLTEELSLMVGRYLRLGPR
jgi:AcrR family transcriptional regulator